MRGCTLAPLVAALALMLTPAGSGRRVVRFGALFMLCTLLPD